MSDILSADLHNLLEFFLAGGVGYVHDPERCGEYCPFVNDIYATISSINQLEAFILGLPYNLYSYTIHWWLNDDRYHIVFDLIKGTWSLQPMNFIKNQI